MKTGDDVYRINFSRGSASRIGTFIGYCDGGYHGGSYAPSWYDSTKYVIVKTDDGGTIREKSSDVCDYGHVVWVGYRLDGKEVKPR